MKWDGISGVPKYCVAKGRVQSPSIVIRERREGLSISLQGSNHSIVCSFYRQILSLLYFSFLFPFPCQYILYYVLSTPNTLWSRISMLCSFFRCKTLDALTLGPLWLDGKGTNSAHQSSGRDIIGDGRCCACSHVPMFPCSSQGFFFQGVKRARRGKISVLQQCCRS
jgi:hypothetical protein